MADASGVDAAAKGEYRVEAEDGDGRALVGRENANLANKWWWGWRKCEYLEQILREGGYSDGNVWFADDTLENVLAVDTLMMGRVVSVHVDGALGRGIIANQGYLDVVEPLLFPVEKLGFGQAAGDGDDMAVDGPVTVTDAAGAAEAQAAADAAAMEALEAALGAAAAEQSAPPAIEIETGD